MIVHINYRFLPGIRILGELRPAHLIECCTDSIDSRHVCIAFLYPVAYFSFVFWSICRYMATSDLANELEKPSFSFDSSHTEAQVTTAVLRQLEDASTDIGTLATKCLGLLVNRVSEERLRSIITTLVDGMVNGKKDHQRDVSFLGLKTIISDIDQARAATLTGAAFAALLKGLRSNTADVASNSLDSLLSIVSLHGDAVGEEERDAAREVLTLEIDASRPGIRKRAIQCLASLAPFFSDEALHQWVDGVCNRLEAGLQVQNEDKENARATARVYVQALLSVTKSAGYRLKDQVSRALPLLFSWLERAREGSGMEVEGEGKDEDDEHSEDDLLRGGDDELLELCLSCLESLVRRSPSACRVYLMDGLMKACLQHLIYDPNYDQPAVDYGDQEYKVEGGEVKEMEVDGDEDEEEDEEEEEGEENDDEGEENDDDDDEESEVDEDDTSWKVRRAAAKLAAALISQYTDVLPEVYKRLARPLVARFNEREEAVRPDIYDAYIDLLHAVAASTSSSTINLLSCDVPRVTKTLACRMRRSHRASWAKSQGLVLRVAKELVITAPQAVAPKFKDLVPGILNALQDSTGPTGGSVGPSKAEALALTNVAFSVLPPKVCAPHVPALGPLVFLAAKDKFYTVSSEALKLCEKFVLLLESRSSGVEVDDSAAISRKVFDIVIDRLGASEVGQEVKEAAISCASVAVARLGDVMDGDAGKVSCKGGGGGGAEGGVLLETVSESDNL
jgi:cullin-associated NEDD8-dissociated protein 1